jgi:hypothetical protein
VKRPHCFLIDLGGIRAASLEDVGASVKQSLLSLMDHRRMHAVFGGQFRHCALALHSLRCHAGLEPRVMVPAFLHILISSLVETSRRQIAASITVRFAGGGRSFINPTVDLTAVPLGYLRADACVLPLSEQHPEQHRRLGPVHGGNL